MNGGEVLWDANNGPSTAWVNTYGPVGSETFSILGTEETGVVTPEPSSLLLLGSGLLGLAGAIGRKLRA